jgi:spore coat polysaccharide biosynthesis protein SpsF
LGNKDLEIIGKELDYRLEHKKNTIAKKFIRKGTPLTDELFEFKRTLTKENSIAYFDYNRKKSLINIPKGRVLTQKLLKSQPKIVAVIACRVNSNRLYDKPIQNLGRITILEQLLNEIKQSKRVHDMVLAISEKPENRAFVEFATENNIKFVLGDDNDVLKRIIDAAKYANADVILRITPENPFMYWEKIDELIDVHLKGKFDLSVTIEAPLGCNFELINLKALEISHKLGKNKHRSEFVSLFINENKNRFKIFKYRVPESVRRPNYRLTVDFPEDLLLVRMIYDKLGKGNKPIPLARIIKFLDDNPTIAKINIDKKTIYHDMWLKNS